jgi:hypothetical protein
MNNSKKVRFLGSQATRGIMTSEMRQMQTQTWLTNLINPVWIENPEAPQFPASTLLCHRPLATLKLELSNTLVCGLTIYDTLGNRPLPTTSPNTYTINNISLKIINFQDPCRFKSTTQLCEKTRAGIATLLAWFNNGITDLHFYNFQCYKNSPNYQNHKFLVVY